MSSISLSQSADAPVPQTKAIRSEPLSAEGQRFFYLFLICLALISGANQKFGLHRTAAVPLHGVSLCRTIDMASRTSRGHFHRNLKHCHDGRRFRWARSKRPRAVSFADNLPAVIPFLPACVGIATWGIGFSRRSQRLLPGSSSSSQSLVPDNTLLAAMETLFQEPSDCSISI